MTKLNPLCVYELLCFGIPDLRISTSCHYLQLTNGRQPTRQTRDRVIFTIEVPMAHGIVIIFFDGRFVSHIDGNIRIGRNVNRFTAPNFTGCLMV